MVNIYSKDNPSVKGLHLTNFAKCASCSYMDDPICEGWYQIPTGRYHIEIISDVPVRIAYGYLS